MDERTGALAQQNKTKQTKPSRMHVLWDIPYYICFADGARIIQVRTISLISIVSYFNMKMSQNERILFE